MSEADIDKLKRDIVFEATLRGRRLVFHSTWGLFSPRRIDDGTRMLITKAEVGSGDVTLTANTGSGTVTTNGEGRITGDVITAMAVNEITVVTTGNSADMSVTGSGNLSVIEYDAITLTDLDTADGRILIQAGGTIIATDVVSSTDAEANDIWLTALVGDVVTGLVQAGAGAAAAFERRAIAPAMRAQLDSRETADAITAAVEQADKES